MAVITLTQVKTYTTLTDADDAAITAMLPVIDSKVKLITRKNWNWQIVGKTTSGSANVEVFEAYNYAGVDEWERGINSPYIFRNIAEYIDAGSSVTGTGIPANAYVLDVFSNGSYTQAPYITLSDNATASSDSVELYIGMPLGYVPTIAKGVQWLIEQSSNGSSSGKLGIKSKRLGPANVSYSDGDAQIDGISGMPAWFVKALPRYARGYA